ncbi:hypothetical protein LTR97_011178 [Elasticomyces elasticus]|uniref:Outer spore wall protein RRT8 n=1 Tax=Elasticomyces elasticus TaxID=574655 RepID=A0AAN7W7V6_9PEZI|nr:hypothetical protein LTR42_011508 [Elasticomyces elasticus]KAK5692006.1 hypothetical protein LTR97_011178 [Elasticomyces elasticus]KAK5717243.1 hypothetical protein LTR15_009133 [Elasticomyces elasticus]
MSKSNTAKVKEVAEHEVQRVREIAEEGARSGAYLYPLKARFRPDVGFGDMANENFTYLPQLAVMFFTSGPLAAITAALLVLSESSTLTMVLSRALLIEDSLIDTFDGTLIGKGQTMLVEKDRQVKSGAAGDAIGRLGKLMTKPFQKFTPTAIVRYFMYLPLNFIPVIGTVAFVALQGRKNGPSAHNRYFQLKGMNASQKEKFVEERKGAYTSFGVAATLLEMIPIAGIFMAYTNTCGAALWAADLEQNAGTAPALREQAKKAA